MRSAGLSGPNVVVRVAWIGARIVGIETESGDGVIRGHRRGRAGDPVGEFNERGLGDDDGSGGAEIFRQRGFIRRNVAGEGEGASRGRHIRSLDVVFERNRDAVERTADFSLRAFAIELVGFLEGVRINGDRGVQDVIVDRDADQVLSHQFA